MESNTIINKIGYQPSVSIIIINYNGKNYIKECLDSLKRLNYSNYEILFVDNASSDDSLKIVKQNYPLVRVIENNENLGFGLANNIGGQEANSEYLFFLNNDTKVDPNVLTKLIDVISKDRTIGICACKLMSYDGAQYFHTGIGCDIFGYPIVNKQVFYAEGSALMIRRSLFLSVGGFDTEYFMYHEDVDLAWRIQLIKYKIIPVTQAIVYHMGGGCVDNKSKENTYLKLFRLYHSERGNIRTLLKNYHFKTLMLVMPLYLLISISESLIYLLNFKFNFVYCIIRAYYWNIINIGNIREHRKIVQSTRLITDTDLMKKMYKGIAKFNAFIKK